MLGHSLGEYTLSKLHALFLAGSRAQLLLKSCEPGSRGILAVRASLTAVEKVLKQDAAYEVSCTNTEKDTVPSGEEEVLGEIVAVLKAVGLKCTMENVPFAFHSSQVDPVPEALERLTENISFKTPETLFISPLLAECIFDGKTINGAYLRRATREPANFRRGSGCGSRAGDD